MKFLRLSDVIDRTGLGRSTIYRLIELGEFPRQVTITLKTVGWVEKEIDEWILSKIEQRDLQLENKEPASLQAVR